MQPCPGSPHNKTIRSSLGWANKRTLDPSPYRRPTIGFGTRAAHQHRSLTVVQAISLEKGLDGLLVVDYGVCPCPVSAP
jgi:hypothetical protein